MLILGDRERDEGLVAVRERKQGDIGTMTLEEFEGMISRLRQTRAL